MKRFAILVALGSVLSPAAFGIWNSCGDFNGGAAGLGTADNTIPLTNPGGSLTLSQANDLDSNDVGTDAGCQIVNKIFDNFTVSTIITPGGASRNPDAPGEVTLLGTYTLSPGSGRERLEFNVAGNDWDNDSAGNTTWTTTMEFTATHRSGTGTLGLGNVLIDAANWTSGSDVVSVRVMVCLTSFATCESDGWFFNQLFTVTAEGDNTFTGPFSFTSTVFSDMNIRVIAIITDGSSGGVELQDFYFEFLDTPEPSTWMLMSSALAGLGFFARRRRRT